MAVLILFGRDYKNLKHYFLLSDQFQYSRVQFYRFSLVDGAFSWTILKHFHDNFPFGFRSRLFVVHVSDFIWISGKKSLNPFWSMKRCIITLKNDFISQKSYLFFICSKFLTQLTGNHLYLSPLQPLIFFLNEFYNSYLWFNWRFFCWSHVTFE